MLVYLVRIGANSNVHLNNFSDLDIGFVIIFAEQKCRQNLLIYLDITPQPAP